MANSIFNKYDPEQIEWAYNQYLEKDTFVKNVKRKIDEDRKETECLKEARDLMINEGCEYLITIRQSDYGIADEETCRVINNIEKLIKSAESLDRMRMNKHIKKKDWKEIITSGADGASSVISSAAFQWGGFSSKIGGFFRWVKRIITKR